MVQCTCTFVVQLVFCMSLTFQFLLKQAHGFEAHSDYLRSIAVHPTQPYVLTSSGEYKQKTNEFFLVCCLDGLRVIKLNMYSALLVTTVISCVFFSTSLHLL